MKKKLHLNQKTIDLAMEKVDQYLKAKQMEEIQNKKMDKDSNRPKSVYN